MGFATTQKAKTTIISSLSEASSGIAVSGKVTAIANVPAAKVNATSIPLKITSGGDSINLSNSTVSIKYLSNTVEYDNILVATLTSRTFANVSQAFQGAIDPPNSIWKITKNPVNSTTGINLYTAAIIYWTVAAQNPPNAILEQGEHAVIGIVYKSTDRPTQLDKIRVEVLLSSGATMTVERNIPNLTSAITDLG
jgi:flagellin FlaB